MTATRSRFALGLGLGLLGVLVFVVVPGDSLASSFVYQGVALAAIVVLGAATWRMPPASRPVWWAVLGYAVLTDLGDIVYDIEMQVLDEAPFPGAADVLYLSAYVAAVTALALLIHRVHRGRDLEAWIDTAILTVAATAVIGMVIIGPTLQGSEETVLAQGVSVAYAVFDLLLLSGLTRVLVGSGPINASVALLSGAFGVTLVADLLFSYVAVQGLDDSVPAALDALYLVAFILMAAAASAPGATSPEADGPRDHTSRPVRTTALALGALTLPVLLAVHAANVGEGERRLLAAALLTILIVLLILWRVRLLLGVVQRQAQQLSSLARTDALTGLPNRGTLDYQLERAQQAADEDGSTLTIAMLDLDHFKPYNDTFGHQAGDSALVDCATAWGAALRDDEGGPPPFLARYGGEEFAILLTGRTLPDAEHLLEDVRRATPQGLTVSIGLAERRPGESGFETMSRADRALYRAKDLGRDRVIADRPRDVSAAAG